MSPACPHCSGLGTVPDPRAVRFPRVTCPKCDGSGKGVDIAGALSGAYRWLCEIEGGKP